MLFYTISDPITFELIEKKSRFICILSPLNKPQDTEKCLQAAGPKYPRARHYCFAYRLRQDSVITERCSDDGEPSNMAGSPILNVLQKISWWQAPRSALTMVMAICIGWKVGLQIRFYRRSIP
ncbi:MAG: YigZ family protein [Syntrophomonadaceae bacterium]|nr:YigZ family protein [Syntrophomonadaceae bacterium]